MQEYQCVACGRRFPRSKVLKNKHGEWLCFDCYGNITDLDDPEPAYNDPDLKARALGYSSYEDMVEHLHPVATIDPGLDVPWRGEFS